MATNYGFTNDQKQPYNANNQYGNTPPMNMSQPIRAEPQNLNDLEKGVRKSNQNFSNVGGTSSQQDNNGQWGDMSGLSDKNVRIGFIRKVYMIVTAQLLFTFGVVCIFVFVDSVKNFATKTTAGLVCYIIAYVLFVGLIITFSICQCFKKLRTVPYNYILLIAITITLTYMLGMISAFHDIEAVLIAIGATLFITTGVTLFALQTKYDFTKSFGLLIFMLVLSLISMGLGVAIMYSINHSRVLQGVYGGLGAVLMALFLAIDTQLIIGNKRYRYEAEDYINAALQLYLDICYMFLYILQLVGAAKK